MRSVKAGGKQLIINAIAFKHKVANSCWVWYLAFHSHCFAFLFSANGLGLSNKPCCEFFFFFSDLLKHNFGAEYSFFYDTYTSYCFSFLKHIHKEKTMTFVVTLFHSCAKNQPSIHGAGSLTWNLVLSRQPSAGGWMTHTLNVGCKKQIGKESLEVGWQTVCQHTEKGGVQMRHVNYPKQE